MFLDKRIQIRLRGRELERIRALLKNKEPGYFSAAHAIRCYILRGLKEDEAN